MGLTLPDNHRQPGFGTFVVFLYALYGAYIISLFILAGDKGASRSADFLLFVIVFLLLGLSNLGKILIIRTVKIGERSMLLLFFMYFLLKLIIENSGTQSYYLGIIFSEIGVNFIAGFIAFSVLKSRVPIISKIVAMPQSAKGIKVLTIISTLAFFALTFYFLTRFMGTSPFNIFQIKYLPNNYYQDFADYVIIAYCCLVSLQIFYFKRNIYSDVRFAIFVLVISAQAILALICSQVVTSNKLVLLTTLVSVLALYFCKPKNWLIHRGRIKARAIFVIPFLLFVSLLLFRYLSLFDVSKLNVFSYGKSGSIFTNTSIQVRWQQVMESGMDQLLIAPVFGDLSIKGYIHSTLLSVQTHLGFIGSLLFWSFILMRLRHIYGQEGNEGLKTITLPILLVGVISSFFTWTPLWFLIGALYGYIPQSPIPLNCLNNQSLRVNHAS